MAGLYEHLLGSQWYSVHEAVRKAHLSGDRLYGEGIFRVVHGRGLLVRFLNRMLQFPLPADAVNVTLTVVRRNQAEQWIRTFDDRQVLTYQHEAAQRMLADTFGILEFRSRLVVDNGAIEYRQREVGICFGRWYLRLPAWLSPKVAGREEAAAGKEGTHVAVTFTHPFVGLLLSYEGDFYIVETR